MKWNYLFLIIFLLIAFALYAVSDHFCCSSERLWVKYVCENLFSEFVHIVITIAPRSCSSRAFFFAMCVLIPTLVGTLRVQMSVVPAFLHTSPFVTRTVRVRPFQGKYLRKITWECLVVLFLSLGAGAFPSVVVATFVHARRTISLRLRVLLQTDLRVTWSEHAYLCVIFMLAATLSFFFFKVGIFVRFFGGV